MFGYVNVNQKELSAEQQERYQSYYCGLCQALKQGYGSKGQLLLNYDMTFLTILFAGLYEPMEERLSFTCPIHPIRKKTGRNSDAARYAADMNILLSYQNMKDDWTDNRSVTKKSMAKLFEADYKRVKEQYKRQADAVERYIRKLEVAEVGKETNLDAVSGLTGEMMAELFDWKQDRWSEELRCMGFYLGKFIYLMDAYEDLDKDISRGVYNPFIYWRIENKNADLDTFVRLILTSMMAECAKSFERLPIVKNADILRNILYSGIWTKYELVQMKKKDRKSK